MNQSIAERWPHYETAGGAAALVRQFRSLDVRDTLVIAERIPSLDASTRPAWGAADRSQKIGYGYRLAYELGVAIERVEGDEHFVPENHPERAAAVGNSLLGRAA